ncbi:endolytic transglycosylase MltG [Sphingomonas sp.]|uniref:endolytic transglycosylase MltG n=1 Tax=Sphingomonas sp. TaxID=28214 RepID=UPI003CC682F6
MRRLGCSGLVAILAAVGVLFWTVRSWGGAGPSTHTITFEVAPGASLASTAQKLEHAGAIRSADRFRLLARVFGSGEGIKAGEYRLPPHISAADVLKLVQGGRTLQRMVVVPEGWASVQVQDALRDAQGLTGPPPLPPEGSILPDSYAFERGATRASVAARMEKAMRDYLAAAWAKRKPGIAVTTPEQAIVLASIVEKETGKASERRLVAAVYSNRLRRGMKLQADPTVIYPITHGRPLGRRIRESELQAVNGYNTYAAIGLPAGPIANPGRASIDAVLDPADSQALYFVADGSGGHVFATTLDEHNRNVAKWRAYRAAHGT